MPLRSTLRTCFAIPVLGLLCCSVSAAEKRRPFETVSVAVSVVSSTHQNELRDFWDPKAGGRVEAEVPFYTGESRIGLHFFRNSTKHTSVPGFWATYLYLGWSGTWRPARRLGWSNGVNVGYFVMDFNEEPFANVKLIEGELGLGIDSRISYELSERWFAFTGVEYRTVLTREPLEYMFVTLGVGLDFKTLVWLREFLE